MPSQILSFDVVFSHRGGATRLAAGLAALAILAAPSTINGADRERAQRAELAPPESAPGEPARSAINVQNLPGIPPIVEQPAGSAARTGVLVLFDDRVIRGDITEVAGGYLIKRPNGTGESIPSFLVRASADTVEHAYEILRDTMRTPRPDDHITLAKWCINEQLYPQAREQLAAALRLDGRRKDARELLTQLDDVLNVNPIHQQSADVPARTGDGFLASPPRTSADLAPERMAEFVRRIQPLLANKCGNGRCHGSNTRTDFQLTSVRSVTGARSTTFDNLQTVLSRLDPAAPESSPLLQALTTDAHSRVFLGRIGGVQLEILRDWLAGAGDDLNGRVQSAAALEPASTHFLDPARSAVSRPVATSASEPVRLRAVVGTPRLNATPDDTLLDAVLEQERPDPFDPDAFNRAMQGASGPARSPGR